MKNKIFIITAAVVFCMLFAAAGVIAQSGFQEIKLQSQLFNGAVVGKTVIPVGWHINVGELTLSTESITWPNAMVVTVTSPDGSVNMSYISRRDFQQKSVYGYGIETHSEDDTIEQSSMMHMLNYRNAAETCDLMMNIIYSDSYNMFLSDRSYTDADAQALYAYWQQFDSGIRNAFSYADGSMKITGTDASLAERTYQSGNNKTIMTAVVSGYEVVTELSGGVTTDTINWRMNAVFSMQAPAAVFDQYLDIYSVFTLNTTTSKEFDVMTNLHSQYLWEYYTALMEGRYPSEQQLSSNLDKSTNETVGSGDSYSALDGWSDVIREDNDYTLGNGSHIKLSTSFDHVYEDSDGNIYAGYGSYYPQGTTELFPTQIGSW